MFPFLNKDANVKIRFLFDSEIRRKRMTWDDLTTLELMREGEVSPRGVKLLAAHFMVDERHQPIEEAKALKILGRLTEDEIEDVLNTFSEAILEAAVPKVKGNGSNSPSEVGLVETPQDGLLP